MNPNRSFATKRLYRDLQELAITEGLSSVAGAPEKLDIFTWHVNLLATCGPYRGIILHLLLHFPDNYPQEPPKIHLKTMIEHPNVFSESYICLDMLRQNMMRVPYRGWSTGYSVASILLQLQTFLFSENIPQDYGATARHNASNREITRAHKNAQNFKCSGCPHGSNGEIYPPFPKDACALLEPVHFEPAHGSFSIKDGEFPSLNDAHGRTSSSRNPRRRRRRRRRRKAQAPQMSGQVAVEVSEASGSESGSTTTEVGEVWIHLSSDMLIPIFECLTVPDLHRVSHVTSRWEQIVIEYNLVERLEIRCFHSRLTFKEDVLGVGVFIERHRDGALKSLSSELDIISHTAFVKQEVRQSVWGHRFHFFLPLAINRRHSDRSFSIFKTSVEQITGRAFSPEAVLDVICTFMNSFVVSLFVPNKHFETISLHASEKALLGYCAFHHLLLSLNDRIPEIGRIVNLRVQKFKDDEKGRHKNVTRDVGKLLVYLTLTKPGLGWDDIANCFLKESFARRVRWSLRTHPHLGTGTTQHAVDHGRMETTLQVTKTSRMLLMFQVYFLKNIGRRDGQSPTECLVAYNKSLGKPTRQQKEALQLAAKDILRSDTWEDYYARVGVPCPSPESLTTILVQAVRDSREKGYHGVDRRRITSRMPGRMSSRQPSRQSPRQPARQHVRRQGRRSFRQQVRQPFRHPTRQSMRQSTRQPTQPAQPAWQTTQHPQVLAHVQTRHQETGQIPAEFESPMLMQPLYPQPYFVHEAPSQTPALVPPQALLQALPQAPPQILPRLQGPPQEPQQEQPLQAPQTQGVFIGVPAPWDFVETPSGPLMVVRQPW